MLPVRNPIRRAQPAGRIKDRSKGQSRYKAGMLNTNNIKNKAGNRGRSKSKSGLPDNKRYKSRFKSRGSGRDKGRVQALAGIKPRQHPFLRRSLS